MWRLNLYLSVVAWKIACYSLFGILLTWNFLQNLNIFPVEIKNEYEYIIVGTGVGGATVAAGIASEDVLVLEAGMEAPFFMDIPVLGPMLQNSPYEWNYYTMPQEKAAKAMKNHQLHCPQGKVFGGSHMLNNLLYLRGHPEDYRVYVEGDYDFHRDIEEYFDRFEADLQPQKLKFHTKLADAFAEVGQEIDGGSFGSPHVTQSNGMRFTMAKFYQKLTREGKREGHQLILGALVTRVTFEEPQMRANGVEFIKSNQRYTAKARKGVILAAGAIGSPKILLQSGIGPTEHLQDVGIPVRSNLPVGENLMDHVTTGYNLVLLNESLHMDIFDILSPQSLYSYIFHAEGPLTMAGCESTAILPAPPGELPNLQFMVLPVGVTQDYGAHLRAITNIDDTAWRGYFEKMLGMSSVTILPTLLHPKSRGFIQLRDSNPTSPPIINPKYLSHPDDAQILIQGIRTLQELLSTEAMKKIGAEINPLLFPGCESHQWDTTAYWKCYVEHVTLSAFHTAGTCSMGSVVEKDFRVRNVEKLFVVDASVMPTLPSANPIATIGMLAHRFLAIHGISKYNEKN
ncbi:glucose dehydrogenase [FAD, quinone]-like [Lutzomyia longipalpis]|uniref:glucose dehydrogenase [FAD, quinone]-like n=1 Tax=Lutzomyia longipalpis TaxID=7200 RepID=UPI002484564A|nr:glucose dehydrogenase [FAD, quinone]-like [Lutzomyia longipalpis]